MDVDADFMFALQLQEQFDRENEEDHSTASSYQNNADTADHVLALQLQEEINKETEKTSQHVLLQQKNADTADHVLALLEEINKETGETSQHVLSQNNGRSATSIVDNFWELNDPNPDIHGLFLEFNSSYFWNKLQGVEVRWSNRMTLCAGVCYYESRGGFCSIRLSLPLLKLRPRKDLVETLLHEMIHAYLFVTHNNRDHDAHGPEFLKHMYRINTLTGANVTPFHNFRDEVNEYRQHWWRCSGPCQYRPPYYGIVRRAMNRAPSANDLWWEEHKRTCGGTYEKIKEPEKCNTKRKGRETGADAVKKAKGENMDIKKFIVSSDKNHPISRPSSSFNKDNEIAITYNSPKNIFALKSPTKITATRVTPFAGKGHVLGSSQLQNKARHSGINEKHTLLSYYESSKEKLTKYSPNNGETKVEKGERLSTQTSSQLRKEATGKFLPDGKLSTASPLHYLKKAFTDDNSNDGFESSHNRTVPDNFHVNSSIQKEETVNVGSRFEIPIVLSDENSHSRKDTLTNIVVCPVCSQEFENSQINCHLDKCLS